MNKIITIKQQPIKYKYKLYWWYGGFYDCHREVEEFTTLKELIEYHKEHRPFDNLYNFSSLGNSYYKKIPILKGKKKICIYQSEDIIAKKEFEYFKKTNYLHEEKSLRKIEDKNISI